MTEGSLQLRRYLQARRDGMTMTTAAVFAPMSITEARLTEADMAAGRLDHIIEQIPAAGQAAPQPQETNMARGRKPKSEEVVQVHAPDFDLAVSIYHKDIRPAQSKVGEHAQEMSEAYKAIKKRANIQPQAARLAFRLNDMEESKRDDFLRSLRGLFAKLRIFMPTDLVDAAEGKGSAGEEVIPTGERPAPKLATIPAVH